LNKLFDLNASLELIPRILRLIFVEESWPSCLRGVGGDIPILVTLRALATECEAKNVQPHDRQSLDLLMTLKKMEGLPPGVADRTEDEELSPAQM
jgi:hypothetical protein